MERGKFYKHTDVEIVEEEKPTDESAKLLGIGTSLEFDTQPS